jgi:alginate O-acetyltransferase complex protein AlgI
MVFSTPIFLYGFLPLTLLFYYFSPAKIKNRWLLLASLFFYAWGELFYVVVMLISILSNYLVGLKISQHKYSRQKSKAYLILGLSINLLLLISYKYANFLVANLNEVLLLISLPTVYIPDIHLPLGISFFTFQAISYLVDVYRKQVPAQQKMLDLGLYIALFPQLIAGPIVRYQHISSQITHRTHSIEIFSSGVMRFIYGLAKKLLLANPLGEVADSVFNLSDNELTVTLAWLGILAYSLQIYFDFSGYSDMAIGLGRMFGFRFHENFNYPYIATSLREFWRRWHISLSSWFRDYVYIPLGGNQVSTIRVYLNLLVVFVLTGFWHGASWNFLIWGLIHGLFIAAEHWGFSKILKNLWKPIQHLYLLVVVMIGWVFFRAETLPEAINYLGAMFNTQKLATTDYQIHQVLTHESAAALCIAILLAMPIYTVIKNRLENYAQHSKINNLVFFHLPRLMMLVSLAFLCAIKIASSTYNPFIYFRF